MANSPIITVLLFAAALYLLKLWLDDYRSGKTGERALPGATPAPALSLWIAAAGALVLVALESVGEISLGLASEQSNIAALALLSMLGAGILEEVVFRGYLVVTGKGRAALLLSIVGFSLIFALAHYQYYLTKNPDSSSWDISLTIKNTWSLSILFLNSLWFYSVRFFKWNPRQSLLPCFIAHLTSNFAVFLIKLFQGHVTGWY